jgi:hypothetical protein
MRAMLGHCALTTAAAGMVSHAQVGILLHYTAFEHPSHNTQNNERAAESPAADGVGAERECA